MIELASAGEPVWGISGTAFLAAFGLAGAVTLALAAAALQIRRRWPRPRSRELRPIEVALINGGPLLAVSVALSKLRTLGVVDAGAHRIPAAQMPDHPDPIVRAVAAELPATGPATVLRLVGSPAVSEALAAMAARLHRRGLLSTETSRRRARWCGWLVELLVAVGLLRLGADLAAHRAILFVLIETLVLQGAGVVIWEAPRTHTLTGTRAVTALRQANPHLSIQSAPSWSAHGPQAAPFAAALCGGYVLWSVDPAFAEAAGIPRTAASGAGRCAGSAGSAGPGVEVARREPMIPVVEHRVSESGTSR